MVRMKRLLLNLSFNSIKVRLERPGTTEQYLFGMFQFHKGTIRTCERESDGRTHTRFQFHKGTIRTRLSRSPGWFILCFNSIKVRLELRYYHQNSIKLHEFQFHKGTIRTILMFLFWNQGLKSFNSIKVRLERGCHCWVYESCAVSIP